MPAGLCWRLSLFFIVFCWFLSLLVIFCHLQVFIVVCKYLTLLVICSLYLCLYHCLIQSICGPCRFLVFLTLPLRLCSVSLCCRLFFFVHFCWLLLLTFVFVCWIWSSVSRCCNPLIPPCCCMYFLVLVCLILLVVSLSLCSLWQSLP